MVVGRQEIPPIQPGHVCLNAVACPAWRHFDPAPYWHDYRDGIWTCWHVVVAFYDRELGIELPLYGAGRSGDLGVRELGAALATGKSAPIWHPVERPAFGDVVTFFGDSSAAIDTHVGVVVAPREMLHVYRDSGTRIERFDQGQWQRRLTGVYRYGGVGGKVVGD